MNIGIIGGGQLGRMLALSGYPLGHTFKIWTDSSDLKTSAVAEQVIGSFDDVNALHEFVKGLDAVTFEWENVPVALAKTIAAQVPLFFPHPEVLQVTQDRLIQKQFFSEMGLPTAKFFSANSPSELSEALNHAREQKISQLLAKTCTLGYDGKGQARIKSKCTPQDEDQLWVQLGSRPLILEEVIPFEAEVSLVCARNKKNEIQFYPLVQNEHRNGILHVTFAPAPFAPKHLKALQVQAEKMAKKILMAWDYQGVLAIEFFLHKGKLLINEVAARVHNSGHWSIEGAVTSQFENHLRAGLGIPLGSSAPQGFTAMLNVIAVQPSQSTQEKILSLPGVHLHLYGKTDKPGRKLGHVTLCALTRAQLLKKLAQVKKLLGKASLGNV